ncbi:hypothetical protein JMJ06_000217 [Enterococcus faecalis]|nr:hypothetical protein [Enterococcus faecalis]
MNKTHHKSIWKEKSDLELILSISNFIGNHKIDSVRSYQEKLKEYPAQVPSVWFITKRFKSWDNLLNMIGKEKNSRYQWNEYDNNELEKIVKNFLSVNKICSQRKYEQSIVGKNMPSLSTLKRRLGDIRYLFLSTNKKEQFTEFELLYELKKEIERLNFEDNLSITEFRKISKNPNLPSVDTIKRRTNMTWEEIMNKIGYDYRKIKIEKQSKNLK